jgi:outer membrane protein TolC
MRFLILCLIAATTVAAEDTSQFRRVQAAAQSGNRIAFKSELAVARTDGPSELVAVYTDIERVWDHAETSTTGAFISADDLVRRYPALDLAPVVDRSGQRFYPTRELREFLLREARRITEQVERRPSRPPVSEVEVVAPAPVPPPAPRPPAPTPETGVAPLPPPASARVDPLSLRDALGRALKPSAENEAELQRALLDVERVNASRFPSLRANADARTARTTDVFADRPLNLQSISTTVSAEYSLVTPRLMEARRNEALSRVESLRATVAQDRVAYERVLSAYADVYLFQKRKELLTSAASLLQRMDDESARMLASGQISLVAATTAREAVLAVRARVIDIELHRQMAERRLKEVIGETGDASLIADLGADVARSESLTLDRAAAIEARVESDPAVIALRREIGGTRLAVQEAVNRSGLRTDLSAYAGIGAARSNFEGLSSQSPGIGIYGINLHVSYPLLDRTPQIAVASARADLERNEARLQTALSEARSRAEQEWLEYSEAARRIALLVEWGKVQREREESLTRLIRAGVRREADLSKAIVERAWQEEELLQVRLQRWRLHHLLRFPGSSS